MSRWLQRGWFPRYQSALLCAAFLIGSACGGGGGGFASKPVIPPPPGLTGRVLESGEFLGRLAEAEPNDAASQPHRLPPLPPRASLEVAGAVGASASELGPADPTDAFALQTMDDQDVTAVLSWIDTTGTVEVGVTVFEPDDTTVVTQAPPDGSPRTVVFRATAGQAYRLVVTASVGVTTYVLGISAADPAALLEAPPAAKSSPRVKPSALLAESCAASHVLVGLRAGAAVEAVAGRFGLARGRRLGPGGWVLELPEPVRGKVLDRIRTWCDRLSQDGDVLWAEPDWFVRPLGTANDPDLPRQWNLAAIGALQAWNVTRGAPSVVVGVVDSGVVPHPDLEGQLAKGYDFISDRTIAGDGDGRDSDPTDEGAQERPSGRSEWHGTHVAAIIAARADDGYGIAGVAPGCRVMPLRALGRAGGLVSDVADAILFAAGLLTTEDGRTLASPLRVVNLSFGLDVDSSVLRIACERAATAGVLLVGASGNTGGGVLYPAAYPSVLAVAAVDARLDTLGYSNFGPEVELSAPGGDRGADAQLDGWPDGVLSAVLDDTVSPPVPSHAYLEGTSQAAPHVAGVAALLLSVDPGLTVSDLRTFLLGSALDRGTPGLDVAYGWGVVQAHAALRLLLAARGTPLSTPPALWVASHGVGFEGFDTTFTVPVGNAAGGRLLLGDPAAYTDDGAAWLSASAVPDVPGIIGSNVKGIAINVDRGILRTPGRYAGVVTVRDDVGTPIDRIQVVAYVQGRRLAGRDLPVLAVDSSTGVAGVGDLSTAAFGYRWWLPALPPGSWKVKAGLDGDHDGFFCEPTDLCGWYGGTSEADATVVDLSKDETVEGLDVTVH